MLIAIQSLFQLHLCVHVHRVERCAERCLTCSRLHTSTTSSTCKASKGTHSQATQMGALCTGRQVAMLAHAQTPHCFPSWHLVPSYPQQQQQQRRRPQQGGRGRGRCSRGHESCIVAGHKERQCQHTRQQR